MRAYYYLLYRLYVFYTKTLRRDDQPLLNVAVVSSLLVLFNLLTIYYALHLYGLVPKIEINVFFILLMGLVLIANYFLFVRSEHFLHCNFKQDRSGGIKVLLFVAFTITAFIITANKNRERIFAEREKSKIETSKPLE